MINQLGREALNTPWKAFNESKRVLIVPWIWLIMLVNHISWKSSWRFYGSPIIQKHRLSKMSLGEGMNLRSSVRSNPLGPNHPVILCTWLENAELSIGKGFGMTGGVIVAAEKVQIGDNVLVGANSSIVDTDFHPLSPGYRLQSPQDAKTAPIIIEDNVFIGMNSLILKGVTIGKGSVIGAGSTVASDIPKFVIAAGNPARVIRSIENDPHNL